MNYGNQFGIEAFERWMFFLSFERKSKNFRWKFAEKKMIPPNIFRETYFSKISTVFNRFRKDKIRIFIENPENHSFLRIFFDDKHFSQRIFNENNYFFFQMTGKTFIFQMLRFRIDSHNSSRRKFTIILLCTAKARIRQKSMKYESSFVKSH